MFALPDLRGSDLKPFDFEFYYHLDRSSGTSITLAELSEREFSSRIAPRIWINKEYETAEGPEKLREID